MSYWLKTCMPEEINCHRLFSTWYVFHVFAHHSEVVWLGLFSWTIKCPGFGFGWSIPWMRRKEIPLCEHQCRWNHEVSQFPKVEILSERLDYLPRDDFPAVSLVSIPNSGGPVYNNRADGYGGGRCSFKPVFLLIIIVQAAMIKRREKKTCGPWLWIITCIRHVYEI